MGLRRSKLRSKRKRQSETKICSDCIATGCQSAEVYRSYPAERGWTWSYFVKISVDLLPAPSAYWQSAHIVSSNASTWTVTLVLRDVVAAVDFCQLQHSPSASVHVACTISIRQRKPSNIEADCVRYRHSHIHLVKWPRSFVTVGQ